MSSDGDRPEASRFPWTRLAAEAVAIVLSILLAFAIDAWWDERGDRLEEQRVLQQLTEEFEAVSAQLDGYIALDRRTLRNVSRIDSMIRAARAAGRSTIVARDSTLRWLVSQGTFAPTLPTLDGLRTSGRLTLIQDEELVGALAAWPTALEDAVEHQKDSEQIIFDSYPILAEAASLGPITDQILRDFDRLDPGPPHEARSEVSVTPQLAGAVNFRTLILHVTVIELSGLQQHVAGILELLAEARQN